MGTTLQNGVYLPNEGERNCYAGLKTNWEILDQKVADVTALQQAVAGALHREIVESLPTTDIDPNTIYMVLSGTTATENVYNEYMYVNNAWELIGTSATDLTNYYTKAEVDGKLLLKASASDLTSHTGDTTIHVTASDKTKWNTVALIKQLRLVNTQVGSSTTIAFANIDDTNGIKVGDKCMDLDGRMFEITAVDTANQTVTVGTAIVDLALDANVVHTSGNETVSGAKTFSDNLTIYNSDDTQTPKGLTIRNAQWGMGESGGTTVSNINFLDKNSSIPASVMASKGLYGQSFLRFSVRTKDSQNNTYSEEMYYDIDTSGNVEFRSWHDNIISLGTSAYRWKGVYATNYYYGSNNVEFSTKFVTSDTQQAISGTKIFSSTLGIANTDTTANTPNLNLRNYKAERGTTDSTVQTIQFLDKNSKVLSLIESRIISNGNTATNILCYNTDANNDTVSGGISIIKSPTDTNFAPTTDNAVTCGRALAKWSDVQTYKVNGLVPSSLSLPSGNASDFIDISSYFSNTGSGDTNTYTASANGWIYLRLGDISSCQVVLNDSSDRRLWGTSATGNVEQIIMPILKNTTLTTTWVTNSTVNVATARFIPCQGNV